MLWGIAIKVGAWILRKPKIAGFVALAIIGTALAGQYTYMGHKVRRLETEKAAIQHALDTTADALRQKAADLASEKRASRDVLRERDAARSALDEFQHGRQDDPEALDWAAQPVPQGERERMCKAIPELQGCTPPNN